MSNCDQMCPPPFLTGDTIARNIMKSTRGKVVGTQGRSETTAKFLNIFNLIVYRARSHRAATVSMGCDQCVPRKGAN